MGFTDYSIESTVSFLWGKITKDRKPEACNFRHGPKIAVTMTRYEMQLKVKEFIANGCVCPHCGTIVPIYERKGESALSVDRINNGLNPYSLENIQLTHTKCNEVERYVRRRLPTKHTPDNSSTFFKYTENDLHFIQESSKKLFRDRLMEVCPQFDCIEVEKKNKLYLTLSRGGQIKMEKEAQKKMKSINITINGWSISGDEDDIRRLICSPYRIGPSTIQRESYRKGVVLGPVRDFLSSKKKGDSFSINDIVAVVGDSNKRKQIGAMFCKNGRLSELVKSVGRGTYELK